MSIKVRNTTRYLLTEQLKLTGWSLVGCAVVFGILPLFLALISGNISQYSPPSNFSASSYIYFSCFAFCLFFLSLNLLGFHIVSSVNPIPKQFRNTAKISLHQKFS